MSTIVLEDRTVELLKTCTTAAVLRDSHGNVIGFFEPTRRLVDPGEMPNIDEANLTGVPSAGRAFPIKRRDGC